MSSTDYTYLTMSNIEPVPTSIMSNIILVHTQTVFRIVLLHRKNRTIYTATFLILISLYNKLKQKPKNTCFNKRRKRHHPLWKRFPLRALFPHLNLGRPTEIDYRIQDNLKEYVHKLMLPVEDWDKEEIAPQIDSVLSRTTGIPCSKCWTGQDPGFTRFWTYIYGDRNGANPKSVFEQLTEEFSRTKLTKRERC